MARKTRADFDQELDFGGFIGDYEYGRYLRELEPWRYRQQEEQRQAKRKDNGDVTIIGCFVALIFGAIKLFFGLIFAIIFWGILGAIGKEIWANHIAIYNGAMDIINHPTPDGIGRGILWVGVAGIGLYIIYRTIRRFPLLLLALLIPFGLSVVLTFFGTVVK